MTEQITLTETQTPARHGFGKRAGVAAIAGTAAVVLGVGGFLATTAAFTDQETVTGNTVGTASLLIGDPIKKPVNVTDLLPGQTVDVDDAYVFSNDGTVDFKYTVTITDIAGNSTDPAVNTALLGWMPITITSGGQSVTGTLAAPPTLPAVTLAQDLAADVDVTVGLDTNADNTVQGLAATFTLVVTANQLP